MSKPRVIIDRKRGARRKRKKTSAKGKRAITDSKANFKDSRAESASKG
jgi:hypothetical protein